MSERWQHGDLIVRREMLGLMPSEVVSSPLEHRCWFELPVFVVDDSDEQLVSYTAPGAEYRFPSEPWPTPDGLHPWHGRAGWEGPGCLMVQHPDEHYAVWHLWNEDNDDRTFACWYLNLQTAFVRTEVGYDTQDLELDFIVMPNGSYVVKDLEFLDDRVAEGRFTAELVTWVRAFGDQIVQRLETEGPWWDTSWADWVPPDHWVSPRIDPQR